MRRPQGRREIVGTAVIALSLAGAAIVAIILLSTGSSDQTATQVERPVTDITPTPDTDRESGTKTNSTPNSEPKPGTSAARGRVVPAPDFKAEVVERGQAPAELQRKLDRILADGSLTRDELRGTPAVVTGFTSRCAFCGPEARLLESEWKRWGPRGVLYMGLSLKEPAAAARAFAERFSLSFPVVGDSGGDMARSFDFTGVPETLFISRGGQIVGRVIGGASIGQLEIGSSASRSGERSGTEQGGAHVPIG